MVQLYSPPAVRGLSSRLQDSSFEERATERVWTVRMQYRVAGTGVTQLLTECPQTLMEVDSNEEADLQAGTQVRIVYCSNTNYRGTTIETCSSRCEV